MVENFLKEQYKKTGLSIEELRTSLDQLHPIDNIGEPEDIANGVLYLMSEEAKFVTGTELIIDGGYTTT
jgi:NAD(P)-dependent dehydrogenase (short-subunit alcohol dehydrogenase family)